MLWISGHKRFILPLSLLVFIPFFVSLYFISGPNSLRDWQNKKYLTFASSVENKANSYTHGKAISPRITSILKRLPDSTLSDQDKYKMLINLGLYFSDGYSETHDPSIRIFTENVIGKFAKDNFPKLYKNSDFKVMCADPSCGEKIDKNLQEIMNKIKEDKNIDAGYKDTIIYDITQAAYIPSDNFSQKKFGFGLATQLLAHLSVTSASESANQLKAYFKNKYHQSL